MTTTSVIVRDGAEWTEAEWPGERNLTYSYLDDARVLERLRCLVQLLCRVLRLSGKLYDRIVHRAQSI